MSTHSLKNMESWRCSGTILGASILIVAQYVLALFIFKLPGLKVLQLLGWGIWVLSLIFGLGPIFILRRYGCVEKGRSYVHTTKLVDTSLYAIVRHPQYLAGILFNLALMLLAQHWLVILIGIVSIGLIYLEFRDADREGIEKFGAVVTDVGAPLSHAAIIARELGIPAVVGCGTATMRLHTGDRVRVNGGQGVVKILKESSR